MVPILLLVAMVAAFFVLIVRPQRRQMAAHEALVRSLAVGEAVMTSSGMYGTIRSLGDDTVEVEIADGVVVTFARRAISRRVGPDGPDASGGAPADGPGPEPGE
ncbi:MAG: preprotein translocase subunit YajC [Acidimicrobiia bacterium]